MYVPVNSSPLLIASEFSSIACVRYFLSLWWYFVLVYSAKLQFTSLLTTWSKTGVFSSLLRKLLVCWPRVILQVSMGITLKIMFVAAFLVFILSQGSFAAPLSKYAQCPVFVQEILPPPIACKNQQFSAQLVLNQCVRCGASGVPVNRNPLTWRAANVSSETHVNLCLQRSDMLLLPLFFLVLAISGGSISADSKPNGAFPWHLQLKPLVCTNSCVVVAVSKLCQCRWCHNSGQDFHAKLYQIPVLVYTHDCLYSGNYIARYEVGGKEAAITSLKAAGGTILQHIEGVRVFLVQSPSSKFIASLSNDRNLIVEVCHHSRFLQYKQCTRSGRIGLLLLIARASMSGLGKMCVVTPQEDAERLFLRPSKPIHNPLEAFQNQPNIFRSLSKSFQAPPNKATSCNQTDPLIPRFLPELQLSKKQMTPYGIGLVQVRDKLDFFCSIQWAVSARSDALAGLPMTFDTRSKVISFYLHSYMLDPLRKLHHACMNNDEA